MRGKQIAYLFESFGDVVGNGLDLGVGVSFADDEKVGWSIIQVSKVELDNVFSFCVSDTFYDKLVDFCGCRWPTSGDLDRLIQIMVVRFVIGIASLD